MKSIDLPELKTIETWLDQANKQNKTLILLIAGDSASGKSTRASLLGFTKILTSTTRKQRANEINGKDYEFLTEAEFLDQKEKGLFLETTKYGWKMYGTKLAQFQTQIAKKDPCYVIVDTAGIVNFKNELELNHGDDFLVKSLYYKIDKDTFLKRINNRGENKSEEYINNRWQENEMAHLTLNNNKNLVDLVVDANEQIEEFVPKK